MPTLLRLRFLLPLLVLLLGGIAATAVLTSEDGRTACGREAEAEQEREGGEAEGRAANPLFAGPAGAESGCERAGRTGGPESFADLAKANSSLATRSLAPGTSLKSGAYRSAVRSAGRMASTGGTWSPYGGTPLQGNLTDYDQTDGSTRQGLPGLSGRTTSLVQGENGAIYAAASNGGVWRSADRGGSWSSVSDSLPTQVVGSVAWSSANGGTLLALTGDDAFGGNSNPGLGAYYSRDGGKTWKHAAGVPDGVLGFKIAVDPTDANKVYAATGAGLFRSTDGGASFTNVNLPTGDCAGKSPEVKGCFLANMVTDVVVQGAGGPAKTTGGAVMAAVGWRAGDKKNADGSVQSPGNGIYTSETGAQGSFKNVDIAANSTPVPPFGTDPLTQPRIGRTELGIANGAAQDHRFVYAIVQDAVKFNGGLAGLDANEYGLTSAAQSDYLNGIWVSPDFGKTWRQLEGSTALDTDTTSGSALAPPTCKAPAVIGYCPGIQAWYNEWVQPDPTQQTATGVPTRLLFGLEEIWQNRSELTPEGLDGSSSTKFDVVGRYYADEACTLLTATNGLPICPTTVATTGGQTSKTTTHPDQHTALFVPDADGKASTLFVGNDGGVFSQHAGADGSYSQLQWGNGSNNGLHTLQPYDVAMAKDGTAYMGLQDSGEAKIEPSGKSYTIFGGDGFFTAVDPDDSNIAFEEYVGGVMSRTADGGKTWTSIDPGLTSPLFGTPFEMDDQDPKHLLIGGRDVQETTDSGTTWHKVFDLGTQKRRGDAGASSGDGDPDNQLSAVDVQGAPPVRTVGSGPPTKDFTYSGGPTAPNPTVGLADGPFVPGTYDDREFTIGPNDGNAKMTIQLAWDDPSGGQDWDLYLFRKDAKGDLQPAGSAATSDNPETLSVPAPPAGTYVIRAENFAAASPYTVKVAFTGGSPTAGGDGTDYASSAYVGFCGYCDVITQGVPFANGLATNVGGDKPGKTNAGDGWHIAGAKGLPNRYITSVRMDPQNPRTVFVTLGGYGRRWAKPGALGDDTSKVGTGHVFRSDDAGESFRDLSANLPDVPANWSAVRNGRLLVATDLGVFESCSTSGGAFARLGDGLPSSPVFTIRFEPGDPDTLVAAVFGRGAYTYKFGADNRKCATVSGASGAKSCNAAIRLRQANARGRTHGRLRITVPKSEKGSRVDVFQVSRGRRIFRERLIARFTVRRGPFTWSGRSARHRVTDGFYFARVKGPSGAYLARIVLERRRGKWTPRPDYYLRGTCGALINAKFERPVFGGAQGYPMRFNYRLQRSAKVRLVIRRANGKLVRSFGTKTRRKGRTYRVTVPVRGLPKGAYYATLRISSGRGRTVTTYVTRRI